MIEEIWSKVLRRIRKPAFYKGFKKFDLIIFDDFFPNPITGFRLTEFQEILHRIKLSKIIVNPETYRYAGLKESDFDKHLFDYKRTFSHGNKIFKIAKLNNINTRLFYFVFLNNGRIMFDNIINNKLYFIFTLYPGGGFKVDDQESNKDLKRILSSKYFRGVIVNQLSIKNYLIKNELCSKDKIFYIHGIPISKSKLNFSSSKKNYNSNDSLKICFVASKYLSTGLDKGYDLFIETANYLHKKFTHISFHVIGGFTASDINVTSLGSSIIFYGYLPADQLPETLKDFDIILSPNRPNMLGPGSFDGFPLGASIEASLVGSVMVVTDELGENRQYIDGEEIIIIKPELNEITKKIEELILAPEKIKSIGIAGMERTKQLYSYATQIDSRINILQSFIDEN